MSAKAKKLMSEIEARHEMKESRQVWSWEACGVQGADACAVCGLTHKWGRGGQNTGSFDRWESSGGEALTLGQASRLVCE